MKPITLSSTSLKLFRECPRCFWLEKVKSIKRPEMIFPSLPGGMDGVIKKYFDKYRHTGQLPPELRGKVKGTLFKDQAVLDGWRNWRKGLRYKDKKTGVALMGALDDCLIHNKRYLPLDYKTRGYPIKEDTADYYQHQLDIYTFLLQENGYETDGCAYLVFYHPLEHSDGGKITLHLHPVSVETDQRRGLKLLRDAATVLNSESRPNAQ